MPDSVALVTGASRGIGRAVASELARTHKVIGTYRGNLAAAESLRDSCGAEIFQMDVASRADRGALMEFVRNEYGRLDLLVNNAGIAPRVRNDLLEASEESFEEVLGTNLQGPYFLTRDAAKLMLERGSGPDSFRDVDLVLYRVDKPWRVLRVKGRAQHGGAALCQQVGPGRHRRVRGTTRHH